MMTNETKKRVMIVEDYADTRLMMQFYLENLGYEVILAVDGYEAVETARDMLPDLILMDLMMPVMDGFEATRFIREYGRLHRVPILAVTAYGDYHLDRAKASGIDDLLVKPIDFEKLERMLKKYLEAGPAL
jgi:CheY-like chemotaxis protein